MPISYASSHPNRELGRTLLDRECSNIRYQTSTANAWWSMSNKAKGRNDRYVMVSPRLLDLLRAEGGNPGACRDPIQPMTTRPHACSGPGKFTGVWTTLARHGNASARTDE